MAEFSSYPHGTPCWVDVTSTDFDKTIEFYKAFFGWEAEQESAARSGWLHEVLAGTASSSPPGLQPERRDTPAHWTTFIASDDVDDTARRVRDAGGTVVMDPLDVFDAGRMTVVAGSDRRGLRRLAGRDHARRAARERARHVHVERVSDRGAGDRGSLLRSRVRSRGRRDAGRFGPAVPDAQSRRQGRGGHPRAHAGDEGRRRAAELVDDLRGRGHRGGSAPGKRARRARP